MNNYVKSPFNYIGNKYKLLGPFLSRFPKKIDKFYDIFCGGLDVSINVQAELKIANDINYFVIEIFEYFKNNDPEIIIKLVTETIDKHQLSKDDSKAYYNFRNYYNKNKNPLDLFVLVCFSFNHQIRFNSKHDFNSPAGTKRSSFNSSIENRLHSFCSKLDNISFLSKNFKELDFSKLTKNDFVYADPPYRMSVGSYNDGKRGFEGWSLEDDLFLFELLDSLNDKGIKFALSNVFHNNGLVNKELINWSNKYNLLFLNKNYENSNYHRKKGRMTTEVLITNYFEANNG